MMRMQNFDKLQHFAAGAAAAVAPVFLVPLLRGDVSMLTLVKAGLVLCVALAALKEYRDAQGYGTPDGADFVATVTGGLVAAVLLL